MISNFDYFWSNFGLIFLMCQNSIWQTKIKVQNNEIWLRMEPLLICVNSLDCICCLNHIYNYFGTIWITTKKLPIIFRQFPKWTKIALIYLKINKKKTTLTTKFMLLIIINIFLNSICNFCFSTLEIYFLSTMRVFEELSRITLNIAYGLIALVR